MPHDRDALRALVEKVRAATEASPALDAAIAAAFQEPAWDGRSLEGWDGPIKAFGVSVYATTKAGGCSSAWSPRPYTFSLDVALALMERALPVSKPGYQPGDYTWEIIRRYDGSCRVVLLRSGGLSMWGRINAADGATAPLAVILALLTALLAQAEAEAGGQP